MFQNMGNQQGSACQNFARNATVRALLLIAVAASQTAVARTDPITQDHPLWTVMRGTATVDGVLDVGEWSGAIPIRRSQPWRDGAVVVRAMFDDQGIYLSADVEDDQLYADGNGGGSGNRWEVESDDSITFYFDPDESRHEYFTSADRAFGVNLGNPADPINGPGVVRRWKYVQGNGSGGAPDVLPGGAPATGIRWVTVARGSVNDNRDQDEGWTTEIFLPWNALNRAAPSHGETMGMNFDVIFDNDGGPRNFVDNRHSDQRFVLPAFVDDHILGAHSSFHASLGGIRGPVNYARAMFFDPASGTRPSAVRNLSVSSPSAYGAVLEFTAPTGTATGRGQAQGYAIRYSRAPITTEADWAAAEVLENAYRARRPGAQERLRLIGLSPNTTYHVAVRAVDAAGRLAPLSNDASLRTAPAAAAQRGRIVPSPGGTYLLFEDGTPFVPVGEHLGLSWAYFRNLFPGDVWDPVNRKFQNYAAEPSYEGAAGPYLDDLQSLGVNTLRVFLEVLGLDQTGNPQVPRGRYWLEYPAGTFNPDARQFILNLLEEAAARNIYLIFSPFDTFVWDDVFWEETPWAIANGGPLTDINDFFQDSRTLDMAKERMRTLISWVRESPHADHLIGWETLNEWDSYEWTLNAEGDGEPGRETEMRRRVQWVQALNDFVRQQDPDRLVISSTTSRDPRGPVARALFYDRSFDVLAPHFYTTSSEEPINNPDADRSVRPALEVGRLTAYWLTHQDHVAPLLNGEWGMTRHLWPGAWPSYGPRFSQGEDNVMYRAVTWSGLASGQAGQGLRIATEELIFNCHSLTDGSNQLPVKCRGDDSVDPAAGAVVREGSMRDVQQTLARQVAAQAVADTPLTPGGAPFLTNVRAESAGKQLHAWAFGGADAGLGYILLDGNVSAGPAQSARLRLFGLQSGARYSVAFWATTGNRNAPVSVINGQIARGSELSVDLPTFAKDLAFGYQRMSAPVALPLDDDGAASAPGEIAPGELDAWSFTAIHPGNTVITVAVGTGLTISVYDEQGNLIAQGSGGSLVFPAVAGARYDILVETTGAGGPYRLEISNPPPVAGTNVFTATPGGHVNTAASAGGVVVAATLNADNDVVVFIDEDGHSGWGAKVLTKDIPGPSPSGMPVTFVDPKDGVISVAYPSTSGLMLYRRAADGSWTLSNLTGAGQSPISKQLAWFISPPAGGAYGVPAGEADLISLVGLNPADEVVKYAQRRSGGGVTWEFANLTTRDFAPNGQLPPGWVGEPVGYTTPWNGQNVAGLNAFGEVVVAWGEPRSRWSVSNLSDFTPTPPLSGGLSAYVNWGINLTGILADGSLGVTWWSAEYEQAQRARGSEQNWAFTNLTAVAEGLRPRLGGDAVVGFTTPNWISNNIYGIAQDSGHLVAYWWAPGQPWNSADLNERLTGSEVPTGKLTAVAARDNSISVFGVNAEGEVLRFFWQPDQWRFENVSRRVAQ